MAESVYKVIELVGTSTESWEKAATAAVNRASKSLRDLRIAEISELDMQLENGKVRCYRAKVKVEFKSGGVEVEFMGRTVHAPRGPVTLALRTGAPVLPIFVTRDREYRLTLHIGSEIDLVKTGDLQSDVVSNTAEFVRQIETMVRSYPDQWSWLGFRSNGKRPNAKWLKPQAPSPKQEEHKSS